jgi:nuclear transport factor 2 (NTF2) superfamily protein
MSRPPLPPFSPATAAQKVRLAEDAWNSRDRPASRSPTRPTAAGATATASSTAAPRSKPS